MADWRLFEFDAVTGERLTDGIVFWNHRCIEPGTPQLNRTLLLDLEYLVVMQFKREPHIQVYVDVEHPTVRRL